MKLEKKKKRGGFLSAVGFFTFFFLLLISIAIAVGYVNRDRLILEYLRQEGTRVLGVEVFAVDSLVTRPVGQVSVELRNLVFQSSPTAPLIRAERVLLSTPKNLFSLYQLVLTNDVLTLKAQLIGVHISATTDPTTAKPRPAPVVTPSDFKIQGLPFPIDLETELRDSTLEAGPAQKPVVFRGITGIIRTEVFNRTGGLSIKSTGQLALGVAFGERAQLPLRTDWLFTADPSSDDPQNVRINITNLTLSTLGMTLKSSGNIKWPEQTFEFKAAGSTTDLGVLPLDKAESEALGLTGRLKGSADVSVKLSGDLRAIIQAEGLVRIVGGQFPFDLVREKPKSFQVKGPVDLDLEAPFKFSYSIPTAKFKSIDLQLATFKADLTGADVRVAGLLRKPPQVMMGARGQMTAQGETIDLTQLEFRLANLLTNMKGQLSIDPKRHSKIDIQLTLPSLKGWPSLLPILGLIDAGPVSNGTDLNQAQGSFALKAQAELPLGAPETIMTDSRVNIETFDASGVEFPIGIKSDKRTVEGIVRGSVIGSGSIATSPDPKIPIAWTLKRAQGSADLRNLKILWNDLINKNAGQETSVTFIASAPQTGAKSAGVKIKIDRFDVRAIDSTASMTGLVTREESGDIQLDTTMNSRIVLSQLYQLAPGFRSIQSKVPSGTLLTNLQANGTYKIKEGPAASPLSLKGRIVLKSPRAVLLDMTDAVATPPVENKVTPAKDPKDAMLRWPVVAKSKLVFDVQIESIAVKTTNLKNVAVLANLQNGSLRGSMSLANIFGGPAKITSFALLDLPKKAFKDIKASAAGNFQAINLALFAEFLSPQWKDLVAGMATGGFLFSGFPFHTTSLADNAVASGAISVRQGRLSTMSFDSLVNQKLTENPEVAKLLGLKPKVATGGASFDVSTAYAFAKGRMNLKGLRMISPEKNEIALDGWMQKDLMADLKGFAYLSETPVGGSFRAANSDKLGRLIVPIRITGSLKSPSLDIAGDAIKEMTKKAVSAEVGKFKETAKKEVEKVIEEKKKEATGNAVDAVKEELKKRGLGF